MPLATQLTIMTVVNLIINVLLVTYLFFAAFDGLFAVIVVVLILLDGTLVYLWVFEHRRAVTRRASSRVRH